MIDATFVAVPKSRNNREDNAKLRAGELPEGWDKDDPATAHMRSQKDTDARRTKKNQETHFGYKNPINADAQKQKASSRQKSESRSGVEHVFGAQAQMGGHVVRTIGIARARVKIAMMNLACNMRRFVLLCGVNPEPGGAMRGEVRPLWPEGHSKPPNGANNLGEWSKNTSITSKSENNPRYTRPKSQNNN